jgi:N5-(cytidine 5'-diphosphoramidyl)-L-glutamine hydrolase
MKRIAVTQRVYETSSFGERRDALDQKWIKFLMSIDLLPVLLPNQLDCARKIIKENQIDGVLLTGGNSLVRYGGDAPERDRLESFLLEWAMGENVPLLGVCRGMQIIQENFGNDLEAVSNHVGKRHTLIVKEGCRLSDVVNSLPDVNAYHDFGARKVSGKIISVATSLDGVVMALEHHEKSIFGVMWHSEREDPFREQEKNLFRKIFCANPT